MLEKRHFFLNIFGPNTYFVTCKSNNGSLKDLLYQKLGPFYKHLNIFFCVFLFLTILEICSARLFENRKEENMILSIPVNIFVSPPPLPHFMHRNVSYY